MVLGQKQNGANLQPPRCEHRSINVENDRPPALIMMNEHDVLHDEGEAYAHKLMAAGAIHDLVLLNPITHTPSARIAIAQMTGSSPDEHRCDAEPISACRPLGAAADVSEPGHRGPSIR